MKFMINWEVHPDQRMEALEAWCSMSAEERADTGDGVTLIGRWHNSSEFTGVLIVETDNAAALHAYLVPWSAVMDFDVSPVLDDEESAALGAELIASQDVEGSHHH